MGKLLALCGLLFMACAEEPVLDDLPGPPTPFDAQRFAAMEAGVLKSYLQLQDALAHDQFDVAHQAASTLARQAEGDLHGAATEAASAPDMAALRVAFRPLSEAMIEAGPHQDMAVAYCPMAFNYEGGRWLQPLGDVSNPYYGAKMLRCGAFEENSTTDQVREQQ